MFLLFFFIGFVIAAQIGGRILDREGAKRAVVLGCAIAAVGFGLWASKVEHPELRQAADLGHRGRSRDGHDAGTGQHRCGQPGQQSLLRRGDRHHADHPELRGQPGSGRPGDDPAVQLPLAPDVVTRRRCTSRMPPAVATSDQRVGPRQFGVSIPHFVSVDFASATATVLYVMCGVMALAALVALIGLKRGRQELPPDPDPSRRQLGHGCLRSPLADSARHRRPPVTASRDLTSRRPVGAEADRQGIRRQTCRTIAVGSGSSLRGWPWPGSLATGCSAISKVKQTYENVKGNKATVDAFIAEPQQRQERPVRRDLRHLGELRRRPWSMPSTPRPANWPSI